MCRRCRRDVCRRRSSSARRSTSLFARPEHPYTVGPAGLDPAARPAARAPALDRGPACPTWRIRPRLPLRRALPVRRAGLPRRACRRWSKWRRTIWPLPPRRSHRRAPLDERWWSMTGRCSRPKGWSSISRSRARSCSAAPLGACAARSTASTSIVEEGETLALVGEFGLRQVDRRPPRAAADRARPPAACASRATICCALDADEMRARPPPALQLIFQDPYASLNPRMTVGADAGASRSRCTTSCRRRERRARVAELLALVGLRAAHARRYPHEFSGGQRQRIAIARALAVEPRLIVCDEPVSALDVSVQAQVINLLRDLQQRFGLAYIFISHDLAVVKHIADRIAVMYLGTIVETATTDELFPNPRHPYTRALLSAVPLPDPTAVRERALLEGDIPSAMNPPPGCRFHTRCPFVRESCRHDVPAGWPTTAPDMRRPAPGGPSRRPRPAIDRHDHCRPQRSAKTRPPAGRHSSSRETEEHEKDWRFRWRCARGCDGRQRAGPDQPADRPGRRPRRARPVAGAHLCRPHRLRLDLRQAVRHRREARDRAAARARPRDLGRRQDSHHQAAARTSSSTTASRSTPRPRSTASTAT